MFVYHHGQVTIILLIYVNDIVITGSSLEILQQFIDTLKKQSMTNLGDLHYYLGIQVHRSKHGLFLHQAKYASDLLAKLSMTNCKPVTTPVYYSKLSTDEGQLLSNPIDF